MKYFVVLNVEGDTIVNEVSKDELIRRLGEGSYNEGFVEELTYSDTDCWNDKALIIKGEIVVPKTKVSYEVP